MKIAAKPPTNKRREMICAVFVRPERPAVLLRNKENTMIQRTFPEAAGVTAMPFMGLLRGRQLISSASWLPCYGLLLPWFFAVCLSG